MEKASDADPGNIHPAVAERVNKYARIFSLINQVYPNRFQKDNPAGHVIVNIIDSSYRWFFGRDKRLHSAYGFIKVNSVETPTAKMADNRLYESIDGEK